MTIQTYNIDEKIAEKFKEQTPSQKTSKKLQELMNEYIEDNEKEINQITIQLYDVNIVSKKRRKLVKAITQRDLFNSKPPLIYISVKSNGLYRGSTGKHHFKEAIKFLNIYSDSFVKKENGKLIAENFECKNADCSARISLKNLDKNNMKCPNCQSQYNF